MDREPKKNELSEEQPRKVVSRHDMMADLLSPLFMHVQCSSWPSTPAAVFTTA